MTPREHLKGDQIVVSCADGSSSVDSVAAKLRMMSLLISQQDRGDSNDQKRTPTIISQYASNFCSSASLMEWII